MKDIHPNDKTDWIVERSFFIFTLSKTFDTESQARAWMRPDDKLFKVVRV